VKYDAINSARLSLRELDKELTARIGPTLGTDSRRAVELGRALEAVERAQEGLFALLNVLSSHLDDEEAHDAILAYQGLRREVLA
jgi:hypothetical protein